MTMPKIRKSMPWKRRQEIPNASVLDAAVQFHEGCLVLWEKLQADGGVLLPFLNTASMAIELYLKTLTTVKGAETRIQGCGLSSQTNRPRFVHGIESRRVVRVCARHRVRGTAASRARPRGS